MPSRLLVGGGVIHLGATSADVEDNADVIRVRESLDLTLMALRDLLTRFAKSIEQLADHPTMAFTHIQPAEPTTMGYRLALYAQDLFDDYNTLQITRHNLRGKGFKGAVGTRASYGELLKDTQLKSCGYGSAYHGSAWSSRLPYRRTDLSAQAGLAGLERTFGNRGQSL